MKVVTIVKQGNAPVTVNADGPIGKRLIARYRPAPRFEMPEQLDANRGAQSASRQARP